MAAICLVALRIKKQLITESMDWRVNIMAQKEVEHLPYIMRFM
jgi:hypothetical protein